MYHLILFVMNSICLIAYMLLLPQEIEILKNLSSTQLKNDINKIRTEQAQDFINHLTVYLNYHGDLYFNHNTSQISDWEYDKFFEILLLLERKFPQYVLSETPTQKVGSVLYEVDERKKFLHKVPMVSLSNTYAISDVSDFLARVKRILNEKEEQKFFDIFCEPKIDGLSFSAVYENASLAVVATRGDGYKGEIVTENMKTIHNFPVKIDSDIEYLEVRGEVFLLKEDLIKLNKLSQEQEGKIFSNTRNAAAGSLRQLDPEITRERNLKYFVYALGYSTKKFVDTQEALLNRLRSLGFQVNGIGKLASSNSDMIAFYKYLSSIRDELPYQIDGVVYKINDLNLQERIGFANRRPRFAIAHKFPEKIFETQILDIELNIGRTGTVNPLAILNPVNIGGVIVKKASLHNFVYLLNKDIRSGDFVYIKRAGDVIPYVISVNLQKRSLGAAKFDIPTKCPSCGSDLLLPPDEKILRCVNRLSCKTQKLESLIYFAGVMNIVGLGRKQLEYFFAKGMIEELGDIFLLEQNLHKGSFNLLDCEGWGEKSMRNLFSNIAFAKNVSLARFIQSIGIRYVGEITSKLLAQELRTISKFLDFLQNVSHKLDMNISGLGIKTYRGIQEFATSSQNLVQVQKLSNILNIDDYVQNISSTISEKNIVFSGSLENYSRAELKYKATSLGAKIQNNISSNTDFLVVGKKPGSKLTKAQQLNIPVLNEAQWENLINQ